MSSPIRSTASGLVAATFAVVLAGCGGATVEGEAPEVSAQSTTSSAESSTPFAEERPEKPTGPVTPPPPPEPQPEPMPGEPEPEPRPEEPAAEPAPVPPGAGDFMALLERQDVVLPEGVDPVATATEACGRFDGGQQMDEVSGWLAEYGATRHRPAGLLPRRSRGHLLPRELPQARLTGLDRPRSG